MTITLTRFLYWDRNLAKNSIHCYSQIRNGINKFRLKSVDMLTLLIGRTISIAKEKKLIKRGAVIVDATHSSARDIVYKPAISFPHLPDGHGHCHQKKY
ncbi:MAG: hypothetical protein MJ002_03095 [Paludibacteraceae bacterium]|nr:hypothetical protein [Paludibacteraceae bacterium]